jgi:hypothetical protein
VEQLWSSELAMSCEAVPCQDQGPAGSPIYHICRNYNSMHACLLAIISVIIWLQACHRVQVSTYNPMVDSNWGRIVEVCRYRRYIVVVV